MGFGRTMSYYQPARCRSSLRRLRTLRPHVFAEFHHLIPILDLALLTHLERSDGRMDAQIQSLAFPQRPQNTPPGSMSPRQKLQVVSIGAIFTSSSTRPFSYLFAYQIAPSRSMIIGTNSATSAKGPPSGDAIAVKTKIEAHTYFRFLVSIFVPRMCNLTSRTKKTGIVKAKPDKTMTKK